MKKVIIIDDESRPRRDLKTLIKEYCPHLEVIGEAEGVHSGEKLIRTAKPDAVFLDIAMQDGSGFDLLDRFEHFPFKVVFQTAFDEFAVKAFKYNAVDYLLKPVSIRDLKRAAAKISAQQDRNEMNLQLLSLLESTQKKTFKKIVLSGSEGMHFVEISQIIRLQSQANYTTFFLNSGEKITITKTIKTYEELLPKDAFFRPHQSHIVNMEYVAKILREDGGYAMMKDGGKVPISRHKKETFITRLQDGAF